MKFPEEIESVKVHISCDDFKPHILTEIMVEKVEEEKSVHSESGYSSESDKKELTEKGEPEMVKSGKWIVTRMVRPGTVTFFYSINGKAFTKDGLQTIEISPVLNTSQASQLKQQKIQAPKVNIVKNIIEKHQPIT